MKGGTVVMVATTGIFAAGTIVAASRIAAWRRMPPTVFIPDFARTIAVADKVQPALLVVALSATVVYSIGVDAAARVAALSATVILVAIMAASGAVLIPLQRRIIRSDEPGYTIERMRDSWFLGHLSRSVLAVLSFVLAMVAANL